MASTTQTATKAICSVRTNIFDPIMSVGPLSTNSCQACPLQKRPMLLIDALVDCANLLFIWCLRDKAAWSKLRFGKSVTVLPGDGVEELDEFSDVIVEHLLH